MRCLRRRARLISRRLQSRLEGLRELFPGVSPVSMVARSLNVLRRDFDACVTRRAPPRRASRAHAAPALRSLAALLRDMEAALPQVDWRNAFARRPMLVCHAASTLKRNFETCVARVAAP